MRSSSYAWGVGALLLAMVGTGCSSEGAKREFTVPKALCGVSVPSRALSRLLPSDGTRISVLKDGGSEKGWTLCQVKVDEKTVMEVSQEWIVAGDTARNILGHRLTIWQQKSADVGSVVYAAQGGASLVRCRGKGVQKEDVSTLIDVLKPGRPDEAAMGQLVRGYTKSIEEKNPCHPRHG
ncbi:hypothetical protein ACIQMP_10150 [Streptomyces sp. NPDC091385]|uniref:hypothetical protein n=1 Tax=Streptomyces sp. NPDC091385 TaxID=3365997 RepID=UPI00382D85F6